MLLKLEIHKNYTSQKYYMKHETVIQKNTYTFGLFNLNVVDFCNLEGFQSYHGSDCLFFSLVLQKNNRLFHNNFFCLCCKMEGGRGGNRLRLHRTADFRNLFKNKSFELKNVNHSKSNRTYDLILIHAHKLRFY